MWQYGGNGLKICLYIRLPGPLASESESGIFTVTGLNLLIFSLNILHFMKN